MGDTHSTARILERNSPCRLLCCVFFVPFAGAEVVGDEDLIARILENGGGGLQFDKAIATPDMMPKLSKVGAGLRGMSLLPCGGCVVGCCDLRPTQQLSCPVFGPHRLRASWAPAA